MNTSLDPCKPAPCGSPSDRDQTIDEEVANAVTHGVGALLSIACLCVAVAFASVRKDVWSIPLTLLQVAIFGVFLGA